jgi:methylphosphotriester-DNA--protein-cysteine methyltransferase
MSKRVARTAESVRETRGHDAPRAASTKGARLKFRVARLSRQTKKELGMKPRDENATQRLEKSIPLLAKNATALAYRRALTSGNKVLIAEAGELVEVLPDGTRRAVKKLAPSVKMRKGQVIRIK